MGHKCTWWHLLCFYSSMLTTKLKKCVFCLLIIVCGWEFRWLTEIKNYKKSLSGDNFFSKMKKKQRSTSDWILILLSSRVISQTLRPVRRSSGGTRPPRQDHPNVHKEVETSFTSTPSQPQRLQSHLQESPPGPLRICSRLLLHGGAQQTASRGFRARSPADRLAGLWRFLRY